MYLPDYAKHTLRTLHLFSQDVPILLRPNVFTSHALCSQVQNYPYKTDRFYNKYKSEDKSKIQHWYKKEIYLFIKYLHIVLKHVIDYYTYTNRYHSQVLKGTHIPISQSGLRIKDHVYF